MPNIKLIDRYKQLLDVQVSVARNQLRDNNRLTKSCAEAMCSHAENFIAEYERQQNDT